MKKPYIFFTICSDFFMQYSKKMQASMRKYFPDMPLKVYTQADLDRADAEFPIMKRVGRYGYFGSQLIKEYELVIEIDSDSVVCNTMPEIFEKDYDVACAKNNGPLGYHTTGEGISEDAYINGGFTASRSEAFWNEYRDETIAHANGLPYIEQDILNRIFYSKKYKTLLLDGDDSKSYYGCSTIGSYGYMKMQGEDITLNNRVVRVIHTAGQPNRKLWFGDADPWVRDRLDYLMKET